MPGATTLSGCDRRAALSFTVMVGEGRPSTSLPAKGYLVADWPKLVVAKQEMDTEDAEVIGGHGGERPVILHSHFSVDLLFSSVSSVSKLAVGPTCYPRSKIGR